MLCRRMCLSWDKSLMTWPCFDYFVIESLLYHIMLFSDVLILSHGVLGFLTNEMPWDKSNVCTFFYPRYILGFLFKLTHSRFLLQLDYEKEKVWSKMLRSSLADWNTNLETIIQWSPYSSEADLLQQVRYTFRVPGHAWLTINSFPVNKLHHSWLF